MNLEKSRFFSFIVKDGNVFYIDNEDLIKIKIRLEKENLDEKLKSILENKNFIEKRLDEDQEYISCLEKGFMYRLDN